MNGGKALLSRPFRLLDHPSVRELIAKSIVCVPRRTYGNGPAAEGFRDHFRSLRYHRAGAERTCGRTSVNYRPARRGSRALGVTKILMVYNM